MYFFFKSFVLNCLTYVRYMANLNIIVSNILYHQYPSVYNVVSIIIFVHFFTKTAIYRFTPYARYYINDTIHC